MVTYLRERQLKDSIIVSLCKVRLDPPTLWHSINPDIRFDMVFWSQLKDVVQSLLTLPIFFDRQHLLARLDQFVLAGSHVAVSVLELIFNKMIGDLEVFFKNGHIVGEFVQKPVSDFLWHFKLHLINDHGASALAAFFIDVEVTAQKNQPLLIAGLFQNELTNLLHFGQSTVHRLH